MNDLIDKTRQTGHVLLDGEERLSARHRSRDLRRASAWCSRNRSVPEVIFENVVFGPRVAGLRNHGKCGGNLRTLLRQAASGTK